MKDRIKAVRSSVGMSQTEFGKSLGVSLSAVRKWESGENIISDAVILLIVQKYAVNEVWLRTGVGEMHRPAGREEEMARMIRSLMSDRPDSFRSALITALLRFDPGGPEWSALERIFESVKSEIEKAPER